MGFSHFGMFIHVYPRVPYCNINILLVSLTFFISKRAACYMFSYMGMGHVKPQTSHISGGQIKNLAKVHAINHPQKQHFYGCYQPFPHYPISFY